MTCIRGSPIIRSFPHSFHTLELQEISKADLFPDELERSSGEEEKRRIPRSNASPFPEDALAMQTTWSPGPAMLIAETRDVPPTTGTSLLQLYLIVSHTVLIAVVIFLVLRK
jgi:hypothetical protein